MNDISKPYYAINESDDNDYIEQLLANKNGKEKKKYKSFYWKNKFNILFH